MIFSRDKPIVQPLKVDLHSHLLPGIDDGVDDWNEALDILRAFEGLGYRKIITTPHIHHEVYDNDATIIHTQLRKLNERLQRTDLKVQVTAAAEYFLDDTFLDQLHQATNWMAINGRYLLFELSLLNPPAFLQEAVFRISSLGFFPVLAHPERYLYFYNDFDELIALRHKNVLFQVNLNAVTGYYSPIVKKFVLKLAKNGMIDFAGSDCHHMRHIDNLKKAFRSKHMRHVLGNNLLNNTLL